MVSVQRLLSSMENIAGFFFTHNYVSRHLAEPSHVSVLKSGNSEVDD